MARTIGKVWSKHRLEHGGSPAMDYFTGFIDISPDKQLHIAIVPNNNKKKDSDQDWNIILRKDKVDGK